MLVSIDIDDNKICFWADSEYVAMDAFMGVGL